MRKSRHTVLFPFLLMPLLFWDTGFSATITDDTPTIPVDGEQNSSAAQKNLDSPYGINSRSRLQPVYRHSPIVKQPRVTAAASPVMAAPMSMPTQQPLANFSLTPITYEPRGIVGFSSGTFSVGQADYIQPLYGTTNQLVYMDLTARYQISDPWSGSAAFGYRHLTPNGDDGLIWGVYSAFDYLHSKNTFNYDQVTLGSEVLTNDIDSRLNIYLPLGDTQHLRNTENIAAPLSGHSLSADQLFLDETAQKAVDTEFGYKVLPSSRYPLRAYAGYYYALAAPNAPAYNGVRMRLQQNLTPYLTINTSYQYDAENKSQWLAGIRVYFGNLSHTQNTLDGLKYLQNRLLDPIERQAMYLSTATHRETFTSPFEVYYVNPAAAIGGDGTYEHPFNTINQGIAAAQAGDVVYVYSGQYHNAIVGLTLPTNLSLIGSGAALTYNNVTFINAGTAPTFDNTITLTNNDHLAGFSLASATTLANGVNVDGSNDTVDHMTISGYNDGIYIGHGTNINVNNVVINNSTQNGIEIGAANNVTIDQFTISNTASSAIAHYQLTGILSNLTLTNGTVTGVTNSEGISLSDIKGLTMTGVNVSNTNANDGILLTGVQNATLNNVNASNNAARGIDIQNSEDMVSDNITLTNITTVGNGASGIYADINVGSVNVDLSSTNAHDNNNFCNVYIKGQCLG